MTLLSYSLASGITLVVLALVYVLLVRNTTHFVLNRVCVLSILALSLIVPFVNLPAAAAGSVSPVEIGELTFTSVTKGATVTHTISNIFRVVGVVYLVGVVLMAVRYIANLAFILYLIKISRVHVVAGKKIRAHNRSSIPPMSWGGEIFVEESILTGDGAERELILAHECAHRNEYHWLDLLLSNVVLAINWYNPAAWVMQHELIALHEYEADRVASGLSGDKMQYQLLLIKRTAGSRFHSIADSLNHSSLKNRITVMRKIQTKGSARLRTLALLPAVAVALLVSNSSCVKNAQEQVADSAQPDSTALDALGARIHHTNGETVDLTGNSKKTPLVIIDGEEGSLVDLETSKIQSVSVLPDSLAKAQYGDRAVNGVLVVTTKESAPAPQNDLAVQVPEFDGGTAKLYQMLAENIRYPEDAMNDNIQGRVLVELTIGTNGEIANAKVLKGIHKSLDQAALDAIKRIKEAGGKFSPGIDKDGKPVITTFVLPVSFKLQ